MPKIYDELSSNGDITLNKVPSTYGGTHTAVLIRNESSGKIESITISSTGATGSTGPTGATGVTGPTGATGLGISDGDKGDITVSSSATVWTIDDSTISNAKLRNSFALSVIGRSSNTTGVVDDITAGTDGFVLRRNGSTLDFGQVATGGIANGAITTIKLPNSAITNAKLDNMAVNTIKGRITAGTGVPEDLTTTQVTSLLDAFTSSLKGLVPASGGGTSNFLRADGTFSVPVTDSNKGDITVSSTATVWSINNSAITDAKLRNSAALSVIGRSANSTGAPADMTAGTDGFVLRRSGTTLGFGTVATAGITDAAITNAKLANMAVNTFKGRITAGTGVPQDMTATQATSLLDAFTSSLKGLVPASGGGTTNFLRADGTWAAPGGAIILSATTAIIEGSWSGNTTYSYSVTVTGAAVGDFCLIQPDEDVFAAINTAGAEWNGYAYCAAANTVTVKVRITTFITIPASSILTVKVIK